MKTLTRFFAFLFSVMAATAHAGFVFDVSVYSVPESSSFPTVIAAASASSPVVTLQAQDIDTTPPPNSGTLISGTIMDGINAFFMNTTNITGNTASTFQNTVWHITGYIDITQTPNTFVTTLNANNDGLRLTVGGTTVLDESYGPSTDTLNSTVNFSIGPQTFDMYYWNGTGSGIYNFTINGAGTVSAASVPEPGGASGLMAFCMIMLGMHRRRVA